MAGPGRSYVVVVSDFNDQGGWPAVLGRVTSGHELDRPEAASVMTEILEGRSSAVQTAALLAALRTRGEATDEMAGFVDAMLAASLPLNLPPGAIDIVGTGGSPQRRGNALNVSTMACFVAAAAGAIVCKHGNRKASSTSGSSDFLEAMGLPFDLGPSALESCVDRTGLGFAFARTYHPAMGHAGPVRAEMGIPTVFNLLGPMAHPGRVRRQVIGASTQQRAEQISSVLSELAVEHVWVVVGNHQLDELSISGPSQIWEITPQGVAHFTVDPANLDLAVVPDDKIGGGSAEDNVAVFTSILEGTPGPERDIVALNAAAGLVVAGVATTLDDAFQLAVGAIDSGEASAKLDDLRTVANEN